MRRLSHEEMYERARLGIFYNPEEITYKDTAGNSLGYGQLSRFSRDSFALDEYVNRADVVQLCVIRSITQQDKDLRERIAALLNADTDLQIKRINATVKDSSARAGMIAFVRYNAPIVPVKINCDSVPVLLNEILASDQENRTKKEIDLKIDRANQIKVVSIIENCGFPSAGLAGEEGVYSVFMVIQHANKALREKYFPLLREKADQGELRKADLALMEDRMLVENGEKQKYGSQVHKSNNTDTWELYPVEDPEHVNARRAGAGLEPLEEYLSRFNIQVDPRLFKKQ